MSMMLFLIDIDEEFADCGHWLPDLIDSAHLEVCIIGRNVKMIKRNVDEMHPKIDKLIDIRKQAYAAGAQAERERTVKIVEEAREHYVSNSNADRESGLNDDAEYWNTCATTLEGILTAIQEGE